MQHRVTYLMENHRHVSIQTELSYRFFIISPSIDEFVWGFSSMDHRAFSKGK